MLSEKSGSIADKPAPPPAPVREGLGAQVQAWVRQNQSEALLAVAVVLGLPLYGFIKRCPNCGKWFAAREVGKKLLGENHRYETVTRHDEHRDRNGLLQKTVAHQEQVQVTVSSWRHYFQCRSCGHEWTSVGTSESK